MKPTNVSWVVSLCAVCVGAGPVAAFAQASEIAVPAAVPAAVTNAPSVTVPAAATNAPSATVPAAVTNAPSAAVSAAATNAPSAVSAVATATNVPPQTATTGETPKAPIVTPLTGRVARRTDKPLEVPKLETGEDSFYDQLIAERLWVGARSVSSTLQDTERPEDRDGDATFIGYVSTLEEVDARTTQFVVGYNLSRYLSVEYSEGEIAARTRNYNNDLSDGVVRMSGPVYTAVARCPLFDRIIPFVGISYAPWDGEFEHEQWWQLGWPSPENYAAAGSPYRTTGMSRTIEVEGDTCQTMTYGVAVKLHRHVELEFLMREMELETEARFYHTINGNRTLERTGSFPLDHKSYGIALKAIF